MTDKEESTTETNTDLNFGNGNPGVVKYGNFINYYQFHSPQKRLKLLPNDIWEKNKIFYGLDIGCNTGDLTAGLHNFLLKHVYKEYQDCRILGIDIDNILIQRANEKNTNPYITFECCNFMNDNAREQVVNGYLAEFGISHFTTTFCFSITMWIHLNNGDEGLIKFLKHICAISNLIIIEPQPWVCYKSAVKRTKKHFDFPFYKLLKIKNIEEAIIKIIEGSNFYKILESPKTDWGRRLLIFKLKS